MSRLDCIVPSDKEAKACLLSQDIVGESWLIVYIVYKG